MEIKNAVVTNEVDEVMDFDALFDAKIEERNKKIDTVSKEYQNKRKDILENDTVIACALAQGDYMAKMAMTPKQIVVPEECQAAETKKGTKMSTREAQLYIFYKTLSSLENVKENHLIIHANDSEAVRIMSLVSNVYKHGADNVLAGNVEMLSQGQVDYMNRANEESRHGIIYSERYMKMLQCIFVEIAKMMKAGKSISVRNVSNIYGWTLNGGTRNLSDEIIGKTASFKNGYAVIDGIKLNHVIGNFKLNGTYKIARSSYSGSFIALRKEPEKGSELYIAKKMMSLLSSGIRVRTEVDRATSVEEEEKASTEA